MLDAFSFKSKAFASEPETVIRHWLVGQLFVGNWPFAPTGFPEADVVSWT
jgi:hypothetical protein